MFGLNGLAQMLEYFFCSIAFGSLLAAAIQDVRVRIIPNTYVALVAACGLGLNALVGFESVVFNLAVTGAVLFACVLLFQFRLMGGGDARLIPAACLLFPSNQIATFLAVTAMMGGVLAMLALSANFIRTRAASGRPLQPDVTHNDGVAEFGFQGWGIPYGVAIFGGVVITMVIT